MQEAFIVNGDTVGSKFVKCVFFNNFRNRFAIILENACSQTCLQRLGAPNLWPLLTGGRCSEVNLCHET